MKTLPRLEAARKSRSPQVGHQIVFRSTVFKVALALTCLASTAMAQNGFGPTGSMATARSVQTATLLPNGKILVAGGVTSGFFLRASAELYDPASGTWSATGSMATARSSHTATLLPNGKVLVAGGFAGGAVASVELYDPSSGTWSATGSMATARRGHTATLLPNGKVLVAGGLGSSSSVASAELYDPATGTWSATGSLTAARLSHTATLLPNGKVLVAGGTSVGVVASAELYDPASGTWSATGSLATARQRHTATLLPNGKIVVAGGDTGGGVRSTASVELYDPASGTWSATGSLAASRELHTATLLPNGKVMVAGGLFVSSSSISVVASAELYDPANGTWSATGGLATARELHTATLLPNGNVLVAGGDQNTSTSVLASAEMYDSANGNWSGTGSLATARIFHRATLLPNGKVLVVGGANSFAGSGSFLASAELYDPASGIWSATGSMATARELHTATLLSNGKVLVAGGTSGLGSNFYLASAELYDPATGTWSATGSMTTVRDDPTATLLSNGKVLVVGGGDNTGSLVASAELYDPVSGTWSPTGSMATPRFLDTATLLPNGKVLVAGGSNDSAGRLATVELYDPASGTWSATGSLATARDSHTATLLPNGKVLVAGGTSTGVSGLATVELYDPASGTWSATDSLATARQRHTATLLPNGQVLVAGGSSNGAATLASAELYDPARGTWSATASLAAARRSPTATLLPNGKVLVAAGQGNSNVFLASAELYDVGLGFLAAWQPVISPAPSQLKLGSQLSLSGSRFQGISQASGSNAGQDSSTNYPVVQLRRLESEQVLYLPVDPASGWSDTTFTSTPVSGFLAGPALVTVFTNGIPSDAKYLVVVPPTVLANISTRLLVGTGDNVLIGGFIVSGTQTKKVLIRAIGPSLPLAGVLADPTLELYQGTTLLESNDNWMDSANKQAIIDSGAAPLNNLESAIVRSVAPGNYTAIERGVNNGTGIGVVEAYDLDTSANSKLANISTRGLVQTGDNVLFAGTIVVGQASQKVIIRALGPSTGVPGALADPTLELRDQNGGLLEANDNWMDSPNKQAIIDSTIPPPNDAESAIVRTLTPANYTAIVRGVNDTTGIAIVEVYALN
jgi:N-acetylneuraminic acid mutarotase